MTQCSAPLTTLTFRAGRVEAFDWPNGLPPPFGAQLIQAPPRPPTLHAPGRLRWRLRSTLESAGVAFRDHIAAHSVAPRGSLVAPSDSHRSPLICLENLRLAGYRGLLHGVDERDRIVIAASLARALNQRALVAVLDSAAADRWHRQAGRDAALFEVHTFARLAREMHWRGGQQDLFLADAPEAAPHAVVDAACAGSAALARVGFLDRIDTRIVERFASSFGPLLQRDESARLTERACTERAGIERAGTGLAGTGLAGNERADRTPPSHHHLELRVPLPDDRIERYERAWHTFLAAYDRFLAARGNAGFGAFLAQARSDPTQRPAVFAWHEAVRIAAWHPNKATLVADLLQRHEAGRVTEGDRVIDAARILIFTPDRQSAYEIAGTHLVPAVTAELPRAEREALLRAFTTGALRVLAGPRLLETGVEQAQADVAILIGGGLGVAQRQRRLRRVRPGGLVYELTTLDTLEIGRASRWRAGDAAAAVALHHD